MRKKHPASPAPLPLWEWDICARKHQGDAQSVAANKVTNKSRDRGRILQFLANVKDATCEETETALGMHRSTASARFSELKRDGRIVQGEGKRKTATGCMAQTWKLSNEQYFRPTPP